MRRHGTIGKKSLLYLKHFLTRSCNLRIIWPGLHRTEMDPSNTIAMQCLTAQRQDKVLQELCQSFRDVFLGQMCHAMAENSDSFNFYEGIYASKFNTVMYTILWISLVLLFPLRHWASVRSYDSTGYDLLLHRYTHIYYTV